MGGRRMGKEKLTAKEKKNRIIKEIIKPLFQSAGYKVKGNMIFKECQDCSITIYLQSSAFNNEITGYVFWFNIGVTEEDATELSDEYIVEDSINEAYFLPDFGSLHPYRNQLGYCIGGSMRPRNIHQEYEEIANRIQSDLNTYLIPKLNLVHTIHEWRELVEQLDSQRASKRNSLIAFFEIACMLACSDTNMNELTKLLEEAKFTKQEVIDNTDLLTEVLKYVDCHENVHQYIERCLELSK